MFRDICVCVCVFIKKIFERRYAGWVFQVSELKNRSLQGSCFVDTCETVLNFNAKTTKSERFCTYTWLSGIITNDVFCSLCFSNTKKVQKSARATCPLCMYTRVQIPERRRSSSSSPSSTKTFLFRLLLHIQDALLRQFPSKTRSSRRDRLELIIAFRMTRCVFIATFRSKSIDSYTFVFRSVVQTGRLLDEPCSSQQCLYCIVLLIIIVASNVRRTGF